MFYLNFVNFYEFVQNMQQKLCLRKYCISCKTMCSYSFLHCTIKINLYTVTACYKNKIAANPQLKAFASSTCPDLNGLLLRWTCPRSTLDTQIESRHSQIWLICHSTSLLEELENGSIFKFPLIEVFTFSVQYCLEDDCLKYKNICL